MISDDFPRGRDSDAGSPERGAIAPSTGALLAAERIAQDRSVADIAVALKLPRSIVQDIEADRLDRIAPIYRRGYVANFARELGLDPAHCMPAETESAPPPLRGVLPRPAPTGRMDRLVRSATYLIATTLIVPPLVYFFVTGGTRLFDAPEEGDAPTTATASPATDGVSGRIARALSLDPESSNQDDDGPLSASALPLNSLRPADVDEGIEAAAPAEIAGDPLLHTLAIELVEDSWVEINDASGERLEFDLLRAGARRSYEAQPPFRILLGRANAVDVLLDGDPVRFEGDDRGSVAEFLLEPPASEPPDPEEDGGSS